MKEKPFEVPKKKQPFFSAVKKVLLRPFYRKPKVYLPEEGMQEKCIVLANHAAKSGPVGIELFLPLFSVKWAAHEMLGDYKTRRAYLRDVYYMRKKGWGRARASFVSAFEAVFSRLVYKGIKTIATYRDMRLLKTLRNSKSVLDAGNSVVIFPEDSDAGYFEEMRSFHAGFVLLSEYYYNKTGEDLPVYPCYYHAKKRVLAVGEPVKVNHLLRLGKKREEIAELVKEKVNALFHTYCTAPA